jgi:phosphatidylserine/phosphatidylglycerophosphate/cardiolipin synthase-like enzyme
MLTNLNIANVTGTGFDIDALLSLWARFDVQVSSLGKLHAKTYIADSRIAFVTSANLTRGGLVENYEYRLVLRDGQLVSAMLDDMKKYFALGNIFSREKIEGIRADVTQIRNLQEALAKSDEVKHLCTNAAFGESCRRKIT